MKKQIITALAIGATTLVGIVAFTAVNAAGNSTSPTAEHLLIEPCRAFDSTVSTGRSFNVGLNSCVPADVTGVKVNITGVGGATAQWVQAGAILSSFGSSSILNLSPGQGNSNTADLASSGGTIQLAVGPYQGSSVRLVVDVLGYYTGGEMPPFPQGS